MFAKTVTILLTVASLNSGVRAAHPSSTLETQGTSRTKPETWEEAKKQSTEVAQTSNTQDPISAHRRKAVRSETRRWPNATVPYVIDGLSSHARLMIRDAMKHWENETCLRFAPVNQRMIKDFVHIREGSWCSSYVGRIGGPQSLTLAPGCLRFGTIVHELGHAIGWKHEHSRPDRDEHLTVIMNKISGAIAFNYMKYNESHVNTFGVPYDHGSIMHYPGSSRTMVARDPSKQNVMGQRQKLSFNDVKLANLMYKCAERNKCRVASVRCIGEGYIGPKCNCVCPDSRRSCVTKARTTTK